MSSNQENHVTKIMRMPYNLCVILVVFITHISFRSPCVWPRGYTKQIINMYTYILIFTNYFFIRAKQ